ncbi:IS110 family transposase [Microbacterium trichothecenolyticum]|uniref:IS110 family transposase n=1 Tax=Microbacterium trichothecenolyticum TaxID=69370 RepID=UPI0035BE869A
MRQLWAGIDAGKTHHHCVVIDEAGRQLLSRRVRNAEDDLLDLLATVSALADDGAVLWATDLNQGGAALLIAVLTSNGQQLVYIPGRIIYHAARTYRGDGKTDAKDAAIIADQARVRRDLHPITGSDPIATALRMLAAHRADLVADRTRTINRLRATLLEYFPGLEAAFDYAHRQAALRLLTKYQTPAAIRRAGENRITAWLTAQGCRAGAAIAARAVEAAHAQHTTTANEHVAALIVARLAADALRLQQDLVTIESEIETRLHTHVYAETLLSVPGFGPLLAAEFIAATGGTISRHDSADRLLTLLMELIERSRRLSTASGGAGYGSLPYAAARTADNDWPPSAPLRLDR